MSALIFFGLICLAYNLLREALEPAPPKGKKLDIDKMYHDGVLSGTEYGMTKKEFQKKVRRNEYYK